MIAPPLLRAPSSGPSSAAQHLVHVAAAPAPEAPSPEDAACVACDLSQHAFAAAQLGSR